MSWLTRVKTLFGRNKPVPVMDLCRQISRALAMAETPAYVGSWATNTRSVNHDLQCGLSTAIARSRNLARNNDYAKRFLTQLKTNVLGKEGLRLQMRLMKRKDEPDAEINDAVETAWRAWGKRGVCEVTGQLTWKECERLLLEALARDGGFLLRKLNRRGPKQFQLQLLDYEMLDARLYRDMANGNRVRMGVEINDDGAAQAYWLRNDGKPDLNLRNFGYAVNDHVRVPADEIIHRFIAEEANQLRGYPWLSVGGRRLWLVQDYEESAAVASSNAAKRLGFFVSPTGEAPPGIGDQIVSSVLEQAKAAGQVLSAQEVQTLMQTAEKFSTTVPGQYDTVPAGYDFRQYESDYPHTNYSEYVKSCLRGVASGLGVSYVSLGNDLESVNYSSARVGILEEREVFKALQGWLIEALHADVFAAWLKMALLADSTLSKLDPVRYETYVEAASWQPRGWAGIDPAKEANANQTNLQLKLTSRRRIILERGDDPDEVFAEIEAEEKLLGPVPQQGAPAAAADTPPDDTPDEETPAGSPKRAALMPVRIAGA
jgi:lambda family phage portal protein